MLQLSPMRNDAIEIWQAGLKAVDARTLVNRNVLLENQQLKIGPISFPLNEVGRVVVVGFGKASGAMAVGFEEGIFTSLSDPQVDISGLVCVPDDRIEKTRRIKVTGGRPAGENLPTERVRNTTSEIFDLVRSTGPTDICVCLISGGGSALLELPIEPVTIDELRTATSHLSGSGASIYQLNAVRRQISRVKGGSLAAAAGKTPVVSLIISDVIGDNLDVIASGPTALSSSMISALEVLQKFDPKRTEIPSSIWEAIESNAKPVVEFAAGASVDNFVIGNIETAMKAAKEKATQLGYSCEVGQPSGNEGDAETIGRQIPAQVKQLLQRGGKQCFIQGGETTVKLCDQPGYGGRNQHLVLAAIDEFAKQNTDQNLADQNTADQKHGEFCLLSGGTDGEDGAAPESGIAGAIADRQTIERVGGLDPATLGSALDRCDSFGFHLANETLLRAEASAEAEPSSTNVCDLRIVLARA